MGLLDDILEAAKQQYAEGAPYRAAVGGLLSGDTAPMAGLLNQKSFVNPMTTQEGMDMAMNYGPMALGTIGKAGKAVQEYGMAHRPPMKDNGGAPLHDLTGGGQVYPDDIYSPQASQYYGTGERRLDASTIAKIKAYKDKPDVPVTMYRAVGKDVPDNAIINNGDWVTINPDYAKMHGESALEGNYRILQQQVPARKLFTNGDSIHEFGYDQSGKISPALLALIAGGSGALAYNKSKK
jgi:hypothetical protein